MTPTEEGRLGEQQHVAQLGVGDQGDDVRDLQKKLNNLQCRDSDTKPRPVWLIVLKDQLPDNGVFDESTEKALKDFQVSAGAVVDGIYGPQTRGLLFDWYWRKEFLTWVVANKGLVESTQKDYGRDLQDFFDWLHPVHVRVQTAKEDHIARYVAQLRNSQRHEVATVARKVVALRQFFSYLVSEQNLITEDPSAEIAVPTVRDGNPKALTVEQVQSLLESPVGDGPVTYRDRAILEVLYGCGLRVGELVALQVDGVDLDGRLLTVFGKGRRPRIVPLGSQAADSLSQWMSGAGRQAVLSLRSSDHKDKKKRKKLRDADKFVFLSVGGPDRGTQLSRMSAWRIVRSYGDKVGLGEELTPHVLRHSCATHMLINGADIRYVQELLGHVSIRNTQRYTAVREDELQQIYQQAHPRAEVRLKDR